MVNTCLYDSLGLPGVLPAFCRPLHAGHLGKIGQGVELDLRKRRGESEMVLYDIVQPSWQTVNSEIGAKATKSICGPLMETRVRYEWKIAHARNIKDAVKTGNQVMQE
jgi:hypothetical protein